MTAYQVLPGLTPDEYDALRADIAAHGVRVPIEVDENGQVLDGHHRSLIAAELGIDCPRRQVLGLTEPEKLAHALAVNVHRRSLTREQRRDLLAVSIKAEPGASDREHARRVGVSPTTASDVRAGLEESGDVSKLDTRTDKTGRQQPASKPSPPSPVRTSPGGGEMTTREEFLAQRGNGEVVSPEEWAKQQAEADRAAETAALDASLETHLSATDERYLLNLARGIVACQALLDLAPDRAIETYEPDSDEAFVLNSFLDRMDAWTRAVRRGIRPSLRSVK